VDIFSIYSVGSVSSMPPPPPLIPPLKSHHFHFHRENISDTYSNMSLQIILRQNPLQPLLLLCFPKNHKCNWSR